MSVLFFSFMNYCIFLMCGLNKEMIIIHKPITGEWKEYCKII